MKRALCWIRRDLRVHDHYALASALKENDEVYVVFVFDDLILNKLDHKQDRRLTFIHESLVEVNLELQKHKSELIIRKGDPTEEIPKLLQELECGALYFNRDYEPYAKKRDEAVLKRCQKLNISVSHFKDHVFYEKHEILNLSGAIYKVYTPYKNKWLETFQAQDSFIPDYKCDLKKLGPNKNIKTMPLKTVIAKLGFEETDNLIKGGTSHGFQMLSHFKKHMPNYKIGRDFPALEQTSKLSTHLRMGTLSLRDLMREALKEKNEGSSVWLSELIWRDFYQMILDVYPRIEKHAYKSEYDALEWSGSNEEFAAWCNGQTGYPIVDAAMRCLNETGFMHNRLRMVTASFLCKTLLIDWKKGERYFAAKLLDYDLAANNGGWQWSASTGVDAQPYFRIFNPYNQSEKFDGKGDFIRKWCPELSGFTSKEIHAPHDTEFPAQDRAKCFIGRDYPAPIVSYRTQKEKALEMYKRVT